MSQVFLNNPETSLCVINIRLFKQRRTLNGSVEIIDKKRLFALCSNLSYDHLKISMNEVHEKIRVLKNSGLILFLWTILQGDTYELGWKIN